VGPFAEPPRGILRTHAPAAIAVLHDVINEARRGAERAKTVGDYALQKGFLEIAGRHLVRTLALTVGTTARVEVVKGQDAVPKWAGLPPGVRAKFVAALDELAAEGIDVAGLVGARPVGELPEGRG
jgi:hypothetical protein